jgi:hypothetical protein
MEKTQCKIVPCCMAEVSRSHFLFGVTTNEQTSVVTATTDLNPIVMMVSNNEHFKYPVLSHNDSIRTLTLAQPDDDGTIRAHLSCARLRDRPVYSALSNVWGESSADDPELVVNGQTYKVTRSTRLLFDFVTDKVIIYTARERKAS